MAWSVLTSSIARLINEARKLTAFSPKHQPTPHAAMITPPTPGPMMRAPLNTEEFRLMALCSSSRGTSSSLGLFVTARRAACQNRSPVDCLYN